MFTTAGLAWFLIALKFVAGAVTGLIVVALVYRRRFLLGAILAGIAFLLASGLGGWGDAHAYFLNGKRADYAPDGEDLRLRNFFAEYEIPMALLSSCGAALLAGVGSQRPRTNDQRPT